MQLLVCVCVCMVRNNDFGRKYSKRGAINNGTDFGSTDWRIFHTNVEKHLSAKKSGTLIESLFA